MRRFTIPVAEFHVKHGNPVGGGWAAHEALRTSLLFEELGEICLAVHDKDQLALVDGFGDLAYVIAGAWVCEVGAECEVPLAAHCFEPASPAVWSRDFTDEILSLCTELAWTMHRFGSPRHYVPRMLPRLFNSVAYLGYDLDAIFTSVHISNMTKTASKDPRVRAKGPDFRAPILSHLLRTV